MEDEIDEVMASAVAGLKQGVTPEHLSKIWRISQEEARKTIEFTKIGRASCRERVSFTV